MPNQKITVSIIGGHYIDTKTQRLAQKVGQVVAKSGAVLVCGGLDGAMQAAAQGAKKAGGLTIGLLPGTNKSDANPFIDIALPTSIGYARNAMVACSADIIVALPGSHGTSCEISYGLVYKRPIIDLGSWNREGMIPAKSTAHFEKVLKKLIKEIVDIRKKKYNKISELD